RNLIVLSDFGNGKTLLLRTLRFSLTNSGTDVYYAEESDPLQLVDIERIAQAGRPAVVMVDNYELFLPLIRHLSKIAPPNVRLVASARTSSHDHSRHELSASGFQYSELAVDELTTSDAQ